VAGITTTPSLMQASKASHSSTWLPIMSRRRSPLTAPNEDNHEATCEERADISAYVTAWLDPSASTSLSATRAPVVASAATRSNQSRPQLKSFGRGAEYSATARS
jgi:hypothetical protein